jgi:hypothetical protein
MSNRRTLYLSLALLSAGGLWLASPAHAGYIGYTGSDGVRIGPGEVRNPGGPTGRLCLIDKPCRDLYAPETCFDWANKHEKWFGACYFLDGFQIVWTPTFPPLNAGATYHSGLGVDGKEHRKLDVAFTESVQCTETGAQCRPLPAGTLAPEAVASQIVDADGKVLATADETDLYRLVPSEGAATAQCPPSVAP